MFFFTLTAAVVLVYIVITMVNAARSADHVHHDWSEPGAVCIILAYIVLRGPFVGVSVSADRVTRHTWFCRQRRYPLADLRYIDLQPYVIRNYSGAFAARHWKSVVFGLDKDRVVVPELSGREHLVRALVAELRSRCHVYADEPSPHHGAP